MEEEEEEEDNRTEGDDDDEEDGKELVIEGIDFGNVNDARTEAEEVEEVWYAW